MNKKYSTSQLPVIKRAKSFFKKAGFRLLPALLLFPALFIPQAVSADSIKDPQLVAAYEQIFGREKKQAPQRHLHKKDPELVAFYEQIFGKNQKKIK